MENKKLIETKELINFMLMQSQLDLPEGKSILKIQGDKLEVYVEMNLIKEIKFIEA